jgi:hypothetical protein
MKALELKFNILLRELSTSLTETDIEQIQELVNVGELGVAFENFCTQLYEWDVVRSSEQIDRIAYGPAGRLIQPVQQPEEGGLSRSAQADDGKRLAPAKVEGRAGDEDFPRNAAAQDA